jgi:EAL domain-containing protein (putative c-di-GMP-specific phosphodiesterase class I)
MSIARSVMEDWGGCGRFRLPAGRRCCAGIPVRTGGVEALVRWAHPSLGLLAPAQFLPLAEQSGLTSSLTEFVLHRVLEQIGELRREGFDLTVAVNLGPADLADLGLPVEVQRLLDTGDFPAVALELEVFENVVMADPERIVDVLARLCEVGAVTSPGDFGNGHSSLAHLKQPNVDELKVDRSFVLGMAEDERDAAIVHSTVDLTRRLGLNVIAEGVETQAPWELLADERLRPSTGLLPDAPDFSPGARGMAAKNQPSRPRSPRPPNRGSSTTSRPSA